MQSETHEVQTPKVAGAKSVARGLQGSGRHIAVSDPLKANHVVAELAT